MSSEITPAPEVSVIDPAARARERFDRLKSAFSDILGLIADMLRDEDWRYLTKADGVPYTGVVDLIATALGESQSMARRRVQGARDIYMPLQEVIVDGTRIEISSRDVAVLGRDGSRKVVEVATSELAGVTNPNEAASIIDRVVKETREETAKAKVGKASSQSDDEDDGWIDDDPDHFDFGGPAELGHGGGGASRGGSTAAQGKGAGGRKSDGPAGGASVEEFPGAPRAAIVDILDQKLDGAQEYTSEADYDALPEELAKLRRALNLLLDLDPRQVASLVRADERGVLKGSNDAALVITKIRAIVKSNASWVQE